MPINATLRKELISRMVIVCWITLAWTLFSLFKFGVGYSTLTAVQYEISSEEIWFYLRQSLLVGIMAGIIGGSGIVFLWRKWLRSKPYGKALISIFLSFLEVYVIVAIVSGLSYESTVIKKSIFHIEVWKATFINLFDESSIFELFSWLIVVTFTLIVLLVNDKYGPGVFRKFLLGRYFKAQREERVFMFLDLRSSTRIAEKLGEEKYFNFLKDVFEFATVGILKYSGEIYQYVGDEIVISWEFNTGIKEANCIKCYFEIQSILNRKKEFFQNKYGEEPVFKAGLHYGHVMAGEMGVVKREIAFSGDVLNTAARIQSKCNELGVNLLASKSLIDKLKLNSDFFQPKEMGSLELRGKKELVTLFTI